MVACLYKSPHMSVLCGKNLGVVVSPRICYDEDTSKLGHVYSNDICPLRFKGASEFQGESAADFNFDEKRI